MSTERIFAIVIAVVLATLTTIQVADPSLLGISPRAVAWLGIVAGALGTVQSFLPAVQGDGRASSEP